MCIIILIHINQLKINKKMTTELPDIDLLNEIPKTIGPYEVTKVLGVNLLGGVCSGINTYTDVQVAIKVFSKTALQLYHTELPLINNEIAVLKLLNHKNIIKLYEVFESSSHIYIITEHCPGKELFDLIISKKRLTEKEAKIIFHEVVSALVYMHSMNICHRDIKPENILFDSKQHVKLIDFDFSCYYSNKETYLNEDLGTPSYACPEMHNGIQYKPELADVWSCGILLYVMVCGYCPFSEEDEIENQKLIIKGEYDIPPFISDSLSDLIKHMIEPDAMKRYTFKDVMEHPWLNDGPTKGMEFSKGVNYFEMKYPIDNKILNVCEAYGLDQSKIRNDLLNGRYNNDTAMYKLCVKKVYDAGMSCLNDYCSDEFKMYVEDKRNYYSEYEKKGIVEEFERKEKEREEKLKEQEMELFSKEEMAFKELNDIDKEISEEEGKDSDSESDNKSVSSENSSLGSKKDNNDNNVSEKGNNEVVNEGKENSDDNKINENGNNINDGVSSKKNSTKEINNDNDNKIINKVQDNIDNKTQDTIVNNNNNNLVLLQDKISEQNKNSMNNVSNNVDDNNIQQVINKPGSPVVTTQITNINNNNNNTSPLQIPPVNQVNLIPPPQSQSISPKNKALLFTKPVLIPIKTNDTTTNKEDPVTSSNNTNQSKDFLGIQLKSVSTPVNLPPPKTSQNTTTNNIPFKLPTLAPTPNKVETLPKNEPTTQTKPKFEIPKLNPISSNLQPQSPSPPILTKRETDNKPSAPNNIITPPTPTPIAKDKPTLINNQSQSNNNTNIDTKINTTTTTNTNVDINTKINTNITNITPSINNNTKPSTNAKTNITTTNITKSNDPVIPSSNTTKQNIIHNDTNQNHKKENHNNNDNTNINKNTSTTTKDQIPKHQPDLILTPIKEHISDKNDDTSDIDDNSNSSSSHYIYYANSNSNSNSISNSLSNSANNISPNNNPANSQSHVESCNDSSLDNCSASPCVYPKTKAFYTNIIPEKQSTNPFIATPSPFKNRRHTLIPQHKRRYAVRRRRNAITSRTEVEAAARIYRQNLSLAQANDDSSVNTSSDDDDDYESNESDESIGELDLKLQTKQNTNNEDSTNGINIPSGLAQGDQEYYNKLALEMIEKEKREEEERQRIILEDKKRYEEEKKRLEEQLLQQRREEEKKKKEEMRKKLQQRRQIAQIMINMNRSKMQQNADIGLDASSFKDRSISMQPRQRRTSVHNKRSSINYNSVADIRKLLNSTPRVNKTRRYSVSLSGQKETNKQVNTKFKRRKGRGATIITKAYNVELSTPIILEFPERDTTQKTDNNEDDSNSNSNNDSNSDGDVNNNETIKKDVNDVNNSEMKMHTEQVKKVVVDVSNVNSNIRSIGSNIKEEKTKRKKEKCNTNIKTSHYYYYKSIKGDKEDKKRGIKHNKGGNDEINRLFIAELEELKIKTREEKIKFRKERERLEKLKETQHEKYQVQLILMEQEKLRKLKENKQRIKKLERAVIRAPGGDDSKYNKKVLNITTTNNNYNGSSNIQSTSNKKKETFIFDKDVITIADTVDPLETLNNNITLQREQEIKKQQHRKHRKHHHKTTIPVGTTTNTNTIAITSTSPIKETNNNNVTNTLNDNINAINISNINSSSIQTIPPSTTTTNPPTQSISPNKNTKRMKPHKRNIPLKEIEDDSKTKQQRQTINFDKILKEVKVKDPKEQQQQLTHRPSPSKFELKPHSHTRTYSSTHNRSHLFNTNINNISLNTDTNTNRTINDNNNNYYSSNAPLTSRTHYSNSLQQYIQNNPDKRNTNNNSNKFKTHIKTKSTSLNTNNTFYNHKKDLNLSFSFINTTNNNNTHRNHNHNHNNSLLNQSSNYAIANALNICITNQNLIDTSKQNQDNDELSMCYTDRIFYNPKTTTTTSTTDNTHKPRIKSSLCKSNSNNTKDNSFNYVEYKDKASLLKRFHIRTDSMPIQEEIFHNERSQRSKSKSKAIQNSTTFKHASTKSIEIFDNENDTSSIQNDTMPSSVKYIQNKKIILTNRLTKSKRKQTHHQHNKSVLNSFLSNNISGINLSQCNTNNNITDSITKCQSNSKTPTKCNEFLNICNSTTININNTNTTNNNINNSINTSISCSNPYINTTNITNAKTTTHSSTKTQPFVDKDFINNDNNNNVNILKANTVKIHSSGNNSVVAIKKRNNKNVLSSMTTTNVKEPTLYEGMVDISCISAFGLRDTVNHLINKLKMYNVFYLQVNTYMFRCNQKKTSFDIEICQIDYKVYYYMLRIKTGGVNMKKDIITKLFCD